MTLILKKEPFEDVLWTFLDSSWKKVPKQFVQAIPEIVSMIRKGINDRTNKELEPIYVKIEAGNWTLTEFADELENLI